MVAHAGQFQVGGNLHWIVYASRQDPDEAIGLARRFAQSTKPTRVMSTTNGWYAVVAGPENVDDPDDFKKKLAESWSTPKDSFLSRGQSFVEQIWQSPPTPILAEAALDGRLPSQASVGSLSVAVGAQGSNFWAAIQVDGRQVAVTTFENTSPEQSPSVIASIVRLDGATPYPQVVLTHYTGGAHCCTQTKIATMMSGVWRVIDAETLDSDGYWFADPSGAGFASLISFDNSFFYAFASYAESHAPTLVTQLAGGRLIDVTLRPENRRFLRQQMLASQGLASPDTWHDNGFLGGWVAEKALIGEGREAWSRMLENYNRTSDWALFDCAVQIPDNNCPDQFKRTIDFPAALRKHLSTRNYSIPGITEPDLPVAPTAPQVGTTSASTTGPGQYQAGREEIKLKKDGGLFKIPVTINEAITLDFILDSGASDVSVPQDVVATLIRTGTISSEDSLGTRTYRFANGSSEQSEAFRIRTLRIGNQKIENVVGSVAKVEGSLLLGQSFLARFKSWSIDNERQVLVVGGAPAAQAASSPAPPATADQPASSDSVRPTSKTVAAVPVQDRPLETAKPSPTIVSAPQSSTLPASQPASPAGSQPVAIAVAPNSAPPVAPAQASAPTAEEIAHSSPLPVPAVAERKDAQTLQSSHAASVEPSAPTAEPGAAAVGTAVAPPSGPSEPSSQEAKPDPALARILQSELKRVGCDTTDQAGQWGNASQNALAAFNHATHKSLDVRIPSLQAIEMVGARTDRICGLQCGTGTRVKDGQCVAISCGSQEFLNSAGNCEKRLIAPHRPIVHAKKAGGGGCVKVGAASFC